jgi:hypothetical protein
MAALSEYTNVYNTALLVLRAKGYQLWYDKETEDFCAESGGWDFRAPTPCGLLGLVAIFELKKPTQFVDYWWREEGPEVVRDLPHQPEQAYWPVDRPRPRGG